MRKREWIAVGLGVAAVAWGANQFAPLLLLMYQTRSDVSAPMLQATYGLYAVGLIPGLFLGGPASDKHGRRRLVVAALVTSLLASVLLIIGGESLPWLFAGRLVAGMASGAAFSAGTAWIKELSSGSERERNSGARRAAVAMTAGFAGGPLVAGLLAQWAPSPTVSAYVPHLALTALAIPLVARTRETRPANLDAALWTPVRLNPEAARRFRAVVVPLAPWVFGASSVGLAYLPGLVRGHLGDGALLFGAVVTAVTMIAGIAVQPLARRVDRPAKPHLIATSLGIVALGLLLSAGAVAVSQPVLVAVGSAVLGAGYGCCLVCGLIEVQRMAGADDLARLTAAFQALAYLGFGVPYLLAVLESRLPAPVLLVGLAALAVLTLLWTAWKGAKRGAPDRSPVRTARCAACN
ncbi:MFS transporter [Saccharopolyspora taberi]|uniref:MFS transporter n=1 Tax=Saccharopolyspora taberi TaxID=60895 RepID=A0ABN3V8F5_9PSEU